MSYEGKDSLDDVSTANLIVSTLKPRDMIRVANQHAATINKRPDIAAYPEIVEAIKVWLAASDDIDADESELAQARKVEMAMLGRRAGRAAAWKRAAKRVLAAVDHASKGSPSEIAAWGFPVKGRRVAAPVHDAPTGLRVRYDKEHALYLRWDNVRGHRGYFLQFGDGNDAWGTSIPLTRARFKPTGFAPGQVVHVRVAVQRKNGISAWCDALGFTAR